MTTEARKITNAIEWLVEALNNNGKPARGGVVRLDDARENLHDALKPLFVYLDPGPPPVPSTDAVDAAEGLASFALTRPEEPMFVDAETAAEMLACVRYCSALAKKTGATP